VGPVPFFKISNKAAEVGSRRAPLRGGIAGPGHWRRARGAWDPGPNGITFPEAQLPGEVEPERSKQGRVSEANVIWIVPAAIDDPAVGRDRPMVARQAARASRRALRPIAFVPWPSPGRLRGSGSSADSNNRFRSPAAPHGLSAARSAAGPRPAASTRLRRLHPRLRPNCCPAVPCEAVPEHRAASRSFRKRGSPAALSPREKGGRPHQPIPESVRTTTPSNRPREFVRGQRTSRPAPRR